MTYRFNNFWIQYTHVVYLNFYTFVIVIPNTSENLVFEILIAVEKFKLKP